MRKKGVFFSVMLLVITLISLTTLAVILMNKQAQVDRPVGERQIDLIGASERTERAFNYLDLAVSLSSKEAIHNISSGGGFITQTNCGEYRGVNMWNCRENETYGSFPMFSDVENSVINYVEPKLDVYLRNYRHEVFPPGNYIFSVSRQGLISGKALSPMVIHNKSFVSSFMADPESDRNRIVWDWPQGEGGERLSGVAEDFARRYSDLPYVLGGISPYPYHVTKEEKEKGNPVFEGAYIPSSYPRESGRGGQSIQPGFDCSGFVWWSLRHMSIDVNRKTADGFYNWAQENGEVVCDSNNHNDCFESIEEIKENAKPGDLFFIDPCPDNPGRQVCHIAIYIGDGKIVDSSGARDGLAAREIPPGYLPGNRWETVAIYRPDYYELDNFEFKSSGSTDYIDGEEIIDDSLEIEEGEAEYLAYDGPEKESGFRYLVKPSFNVDTGYNFSVYDNLRRQSLDFIEDVQNCEEKEEEMRVEECVDELIVDVGGEDFDWSRNCTDKETMFRHRLEDVLRGCFESDCESCYCNLTLPENEIFDGLEYEFFISTNILSEEIVLPFEEGDEEIEEEFEEKQLIPEEMVLFAYFDDEDELEFEESEGYPFIVNYDNTGKGAIEPIENGDGFFARIIGFFSDLLFGSDDDSINNIYFIKKEGKTAMIGEEDLNELISKKEEESEEEDDGSEDKMDEEFPECVYSEKREYRFCVSTDEIIPAKKDGGVEWKNIEYDFGLYFPKEFS